MGASGLARPFVCPADFVGGNEQFMLQKKVLDGALVVEKLSLSHFFDGG